MKKYVVMGDPIQHSLSPRIHLAFAQQFNFQLSYDRRLVSRNSLLQALQAFEKEGGNGANITLPLKEEAWRLTSSHTPRANLAKAVNTITLGGGTVWQGDNTDGVGLLRDLQLNHQFDLRNKRIVILGAGGAARGILAPLLAASPACILLVNRTLIKAEQIVTDFQPEFPQTPLLVASFATLPEGKFDLIINATAAGSKGEAFTLSKNIVQNAICYDLAYGQAARFFLDWAHHEGAAVCIDGLGMLVEQAAEAFYVWHGVRPDTKLVINALCNYSQL